MILCTEGKRALKHLPAPLNHFCTPLHSAIFDLPDIISQKRGMSQHLERYPPAVAAGSSQGPPPGPPLPNMVPYPHGFATAGASSRSFFPPSEPLILRSNAPPLPSLPRPPIFAPFPPIGHFSTKPPRHSQKKSMNTGPIDDDDQVQKARAEAKAAKAQDRRGTKPNAQHTPSLDPTGQPGHRRSRLPSNKAPRKMPLSADGRPPGISRRNTPVQRPAEGSNANKRHSTKKSLQNAGYATTSAYGSRRRSSQDTYYPTASGSDFKRGTSGPSNSAFPSQQDTPSLDQPYLAPGTSRTQHMILDTNDEVAFSSSNRAIGPPDSSSLAAVEPPQAPAIPSKVPRPRYDYTIPEKLRGVHIALGQDNWNEYLTLMEDLWTGDITGEEFAVGTKRLCMFSDDRIRKRMNNLMAMQIVVPHLAQLTPGGGEKREEVEKVLANAN